tara:strand:+ start:314 stop:577 length:264 start_codon:yes stop_codon:yes gene_type:complete
MTNKKGGSSFYTILIVIAILFLAFSIPQFNIFSKAVKETTSCPEENCATSCKLSGRDSQHQWCKDKMKEKEVDNSDKYLCCLQKNDE